MAQQSALKRKFAACGQPLNGQGGVLGLILRNQPVIAV